MTFSKEWDDRYSENTHMSNWPWSDLVSYVKRYTDIQSDSNVLELGCGSGANIPFFLSLNANYHGIDGSPTIIEKLKQNPKYDPNEVFGMFNSKNIGGKGGIKEQIRWANSSIGGYNKDQVEMFCEDQVGYCGD